MIVLHYQEFSSSLASQIITRRLSICTFARVFVMDGHFDRVVIASPSCFAFPSLFSYKLPPASPHAFKLRHHCLHFAVYLPSHIILLCHFPPSSPTSSPNFPWSRASSVLLKMLLVVVGLDHRSLALIWPGPLELHTSPSPRLATCSLRMYATWHEQRLHSFGNFSPNVVCIYSHAVDHDQLCILSRGPFIVNCLLSGPYQQSHGKLDMKNFITTPGSSTCCMEQKSSDHIIADVNDDNIDKGQCHHFSIREYVRQMQMSNSIVCSLSDEHINSSLVTAKTYRRWNCKNCWDKLESLYNTTPARTLNEFARVPEHAVRKELSQGKGSTKFHSPSSYNKESTEVDQAINDLYDSTPINKDNGSAKYLSPSWGNKESSDGNPVINGLHEASSSNPDGTKKMLGNVDFMDDTNLPDTCQKINEKKEINDKEKLEFLHGEPMLGRSKKGNSVKSLPVKRKDETHASLHNIDKNVSKTYKRRKNTKVHDFINDSSVVDCQNRSESNIAGNSKEKHVISIMLPDGGLLRPGVCLSEENIPYTTSIMDVDESIQNNGVYQIPCGSENELACSKMYLSKVSPGKSEQTHRKTTEEEEVECVINSVKEVSTKVQSKKSNPEFSQLKQQKSPHLHNEQPVSEEDDCVIISVTEVSTRLQSEQSQNDLSKKESQIPDFTWFRHQQFQHFHDEVSLGNATEDKDDDCVITSVNDVSTRLRSGESHNQYDGENLTSYRDNTILNGSFSPTVDISAKYQHPQNFSKPFRPVPRIGVLSLTLQTEVTTYSESCGTQSGYRLGMSEEKTPCQMYRGENLSLSSSQQFLANCSPQHLGYVTPVSSPEQERGNSHSTKGKSKIVDPLDKSSEEDICDLSLSLSLRP